MSNQPTKVICKCVTCTLLREDGGCYRAMVAAKVAKVAKAAKAVKAAKAAKAMKAAIIVVFNAPERFATYDATAEQRALTKAILDGLRDTEDYGDGGESLGVCNRSIKKNRRNMR